MDLDEEVTFWGDIEDLELLPDDLEIGVDGKI